MMLNGSLFSNARWGELQTFFAAGNPPLILVLLAMNTFFIVFWRIKRSNAKYRLRPFTALFVQFSLIAANFCVMFQDGLFSIATAIKHMI
jgi:hypothetical protein